MAFKYFILSYILLFGGKVFLSSRLKKDMTLIIIQSTSIQNLRSSLLAVTIYGPFQAIRALLGHDPLGRT